MPKFKPPRPGEVAIDLPDNFDAGLYFIGRIHTPWKTTSDCPKGSRARAEGGVSTIEIFPRFAAGLKDITLCSHAIALYWLHQAQRNLIEQLPSHLTVPRGVFALRSPVRPNPIGHAVVEILGLEGQNLRVRNMDCVDGTPLIDLKPYFPSTDSVPQATRP